jgi:hypothetical protein
MITFDGEWCFFFFWEKNDLFSNSKFIASHHYKFTIQVYRNMKLKGPAGKASVFIADEIWRVWNFKL